MSFVNQSGGLREVLAVRIDVIRLGRNGAESEVRSRLWSVLPALLVHLSSRRGLVDIESDPLPFRYSKRLLNASPLMNCFEMLQTLVAGLCVSLRLLQWVWSRFFIDGKYVFVDSLSNMFVRRKDSPFLESTSFLEELRSFSTPSLQLDW